MADAEPLSFTFGLIAALEREVRPFLARVQGKHWPGTPRPTWRFYLGAWSGVVVVAGIGAPHAEQATRHLTSTHSPRLLFSLGFGGAALPGLEPGTVVLGQDYWQYDPDGPTLKRLCPPRPPLPLTELEARLHANSIPACIGTLVTTPRIITKRTETQPLLDFPNPVLDLETAAVAAVAQAQGRAFLGVRAITDPGDEEIADFLAALIHRHPEVGYKAALTAVLKNPTRLPYLLTLWPRSRQASRRLAAALMTLFPDLGAVISRLYEGHSHPRQRGGEEADSGPIA